MGQAQQPPITVIEPENLETVFITGGHIEAIDTQTVRIVAWVDRPATNSQNSRSRCGAVECGYGIECANAGGNSSCYGRATAA
jgi:hypothetical protein